MAKRKRPRDSNRLAKFTVDVPTGKSNSNETTDAKGPKGEKRSADVIGAAI